MVVLGSIYLLLADDVDAVIRDEQPEECTCGYQHNVYRQQSRGRSVPKTQSSSSHPRIGSPASEETGILPLHEQPTANSTPDETQHPPRRTSNAGRYKVAKFLNKMGDALGNPPRGLVEDQVLMDDAYTFPTVPAEALRDGHLQETMATYSSMVDHSQSRAPSARGSSPSSPRTSRSRSPNRASTLPTRRSSPDARRLMSHHIDISRAEGNRPQPFGESLTVPRPALHGATGEASSSRSMALSRRTRRRISSPAKFLGASSFKGANIVAPTKAVDSISLLSLPSPSEPAEQEIVDNEDDRSSKPDG